jgi:hypothetical protein
VNIFETSSISTPCLYPRTTGHEGFSVTPSGATVVLFLVATCAQFTWKQFPNQEVSTKTCFCRLFSCALHKMHTKAQLAGYAFFRRVRKIAKSIEKFGPHWTDFDGT